jgi:hypothetical protein
VLGLVAAVAASVPYIGIVIGVVPTVLMAAGLRSPEAGAAIVAVALAAQVAEALVVRRFVDRRTLHVGPAIPVIVGSVGLEVYGIGGALYGVALAVFLLATADAAATEADEPLPTPNQDWAGDQGPAVEPAPDGGSGGDAAPPGGGADAPVEQVPADVVVAPAPAASPPPGVTR